MTGLHDKRATSESRRSKRLERSKPEAAMAAPPASRARHAEGPVPPRKRESSVRAARRGAEAPVPPPKRDGRGPAARVARPPSPPYGDRDPGDVTVAPPPARRAEAPAPPPKPRLGCGHIIMPRTAYQLRNRLVPDTSDPKPLPTPTSTPRRDEEWGERKCGGTWQTPMCARVGLEYYNSMNQGDEHELVKAVSSNAFFFNGIWFHANFLAKRKGATNCVDLVPKYFFAEILSWTGGHSCVSCVKLEPGDPKKIGGCGLCSEKMMHPAGGGYHGARPRPVRHAPDGLQISFSF